MKLYELKGYEFGKQSVHYEERDAILYALSVGARSSETSLIYERDLRVLPAFACTLGLWAVEFAGGLGVYDRNYSLHASQSLEVFQPLPKSGEFETAGKITGVWDKGKSAILDVEVECEYFRVSYGIFLPGLGGWGGERGVSSTEEVEGMRKSWSGTYKTSTEQAALYRLTGDLHPIHIDTVVAQANNFERPILHGLCTLGIVARIISESLGAKPTDLKKMEARLSSPVMPGDLIEVTADYNSNDITFEASVGTISVIKDGRALF
jgi:acyl dehydratase|tara:strand:+ start:880 stop:1674 length:795 start_codon:yes stop_codon:yes gene_type:complete